MSDKLKLRFKDENGQDYIKWETKRIEDIADIKSSSIKSNVANGNYYNLTMGSVSEDGLLILDKKTNSNINLLKKNQLIMPTRDIGKGLIIGRVALIDKDNKYVAGNCLYTLNIKHDDSRFIFYQINSEKYRLDFLKKVTGSAQLMITEKDVRTQKIYMPCLQEQQKIADFLSTVDEKIENQKEIVANWEEIKKGLIQKIFSQEIRFKDENGQEYNEWKSEKLDSVFKITAGGDINKKNVSLNKIEPFIYPILSNSIENSGLYGYTDKFKISDESITVTGRGTIGVATMRVEPYYPIVRLLTLIPKRECSLKFYEEAINYTKITVESTGVPQLTAPQLSKIDISAPSLEEQHKIADLLSAVDKKIKCEKNILNELIELKKGLLQRIFA